MHFAFLMGVRTYFECIIFILLGAEKDTGCTLEVPIVLFSLASLSLRVSARVTSLPIKITFFPCLIGIKKVSFEFNFWVYQ